MFSSFFFPPFLLVGWDSRLIDFERLNFSLSSGKSLIPLLLMFCSKLLSIGVSVFRLCASKGMC